MKNPTVSIIVPCYNYAHLLGETLKSVQSQTLENWECIVVDDGSSDATSAIVEDWRTHDKRFVLVRQTQSGVSAARNAGLALARGQWIQFLDADDLIEPCKLQSQVEFLEAHPEVDISISRAHFFPLGFLPENNKSIAHEMQGQEAVFQLLKGNSCVVNAPLTKRMWCEKLGGFDVSMRVNEDWEFWLRAANAGARFAPLLDATQNRAVVRIHKGSLSCSALRMHLSLLELRARWDREGFFAREWEDEARAENRKHWLADEWTVAKMQAREKQVGQGWKRAFLLALRGKKPKFWILLLAYSFYAQPFFRQLMTRRNKQ